MMNIRPVKTRIFREGNDLLNFITNQVKRLHSGDILVVTSKIVALSEGRVRDIRTEKERERVIREESQWQVKTKWTWLTIKDHMVMQSAGIDRSNANGKTILLPKDSFRTASELRRALMKKFRITKLGVLITDSRLFPLRAGIVGVALGYAGFKGVLDNRGKKDIFGRKLKMTRVDIADGLATAAVLEMGEAAEQRPLAVITDAPVEYTDRVNRRELMMDFREDAYLPLFAQAKKVKMKRVKGPW